MMMVVAVVVVVMLLQEDGTAAGCGNFGNYLKNPQFRFRLKNSAAKCRVYARLQAKNTTSPSMNLSLYPLDETSEGVRLSSRSNPKKALATSCEGIYSDAPSGVRTAEVELTGGGMWALVPSTFNPNESAEFTIHFYHTPSSPVVFL